eukprot:jgi/Galph1/982/GphlegSOOS_G5617.1
MDHKIQRVSRACHHRLSLAHAVLDTTAALKELVENALDAKATQIDINLSGPSAVDLLQVADNGIGIERKDFALLCKPSSTSKLSQYEDLGFLRTLGFRGEALASLCLLGRAQLLTRTADVDYASCLDFDEYGNVLQVTKTSRKCGTTVTVKDFFHSFPVRREALIKASKRETTRLVELVQQYALMSTGVRFSLSIDGKRVISTQGSDNLLANIVQIFSSKVVSSLTAISIDPIKCFDGISRMIGYVSKPEKNCARSAADRQYIFLRKRPVELKRLCLLLTKLYQKQVNQRIYPMLFLNLELADETFDVNISADKRQVFLQNEADFYKIMKNYFIDLWKVEDYSFYSQDGFSSSSSRVSLGASSEKEKTDSRTITPSKEGDHAIIEENINPSNFCRRKSVESEVSVKDWSSSLDDIFVTTGERNWDTSHFSDVATKRMKTLLTVGASMTKKRRKSLLEYVAEKGRQSVDSSLSQQRKNSLELDSSPMSNSYALSETSVQRGDGTSSHGSESFEEPVDNLHISKQLFPLSRLEMLQNSTKLVFCHTLGSCSKMHDEKDLDNYQTPEMELQQRLSKQEFLCMEAIGQFNQGFIIAKWKSHLFIIDQHAADERYNFEMLQKQKGELPSQPLLQPLNLTLSAEEEWLLMNHLGWIESWGFRFLVNMDENPGNRVSLIQVPFHEKTTFGIDDVLEMVHQLRSGLVMSASDVRFPKLEAAYASQACRMSVMIGTCLHRSEMTKILSRLSLLNDPWRCPHGRPTIRHLFDLNAFTTLECSDV